MIMRRRLLDLLRAHGEKKSSKRGRLVALPDMPAFGGASGRSDAAQSGV